MADIGDEIERLALSSAGDFIRSGEFDEQIVGIIVETVRGGPDEPLTPIGFLLKMAVELIDKSSPPIGFLEAKAVASRAYADFRRDNKVRFGDEGWDWSGSGARLIASEYEIQYWEIINA